MINPNIIKNLHTALKQNEKKQSSYDTEATVLRVEDGTAWVHIPGGVDETPVKMTITAKEGDTVQLRVSGGTAFLVGNKTAPPTDDSKAVSMNKALTKVVTKVKEVALEASKIAGNTNQYFWFTQTGTDTGAHITEIPQDKFLEDPANGGGNFLARSNGAAVRNGITELATFGANLIELGKNSRNSIIEFCNGLVDLKVEELQSNTFTQATFEIKDVYDPADQKTRQSAVIMMAKNSLADNSVIKNAVIQAYASAYLGASQVNLDADMIQITGDTLLVNGTYSGRIIGQMMSTSWTTPTVESSRISIDDGGYYTEGKRVYVQMKFTMSTDVSADGSLVVASGMPVPLDVDNVVLAASVRARSGAAVHVNSSGELQIIADPDHAISSGHVVRVTGVYTIS